MKKLPLLLLSLFAWFITLAQHQSTLRYQFEPIGFQQGLASGQTHCIFQASNGIIWTGTNLGASFFDGYTFTNFYQSDNNQQIEFINDFAEDATGTIWAGGKNGLFYFSKGQFHLLPGTPELITELEFSADGQLWIAGNAFVPFHLSAAHIKAVQNGADLSPTPFVSAAEWNAKMGQLQVWDMTLNEQDQVYFANDHNVAYFDGETLHNLVRSESRDWYNFIAPLSTDSVFTGGYHSFFSQVQSPGINHLTGRLFSSGYQVKNSIYYTGGSEIYQYQNGKTHQLFTLEDYDCDDYWILDLLVDQEGAFWIATYEGALLKFTPSYFKLYPAEEFNELTTNFCLQTSPSKEILIGSHRGKVWVKNQGSFGPYLPKPPKLPLNGGVYDLHFRPDSSLWLATELSGLFRYRNGSYQVFSEADGLMGNNLFFLFEDPEGRLWSGGDRGITKIIRPDAEQPVFKAILPASLNPAQDHEKLKSASHYPTFRQMIADQQGRLWLPSDYGLYQVHHDSLLRRPFSGTKNPFPPLLDICEDEAGFFWFSTLGEGLWQGEIDDNQVINIIRKWTTSDGLLTNTISALHLDKNNRLWLASPQGLSYLDQEQVQSFTLEDGWSSHLTHNLKLLETSDSLLWISSFTALANFPLYNFQLNEQTPIAILQSVELLDLEDELANFATRLHHQSGLPEELTLPYNKNTLSFHFSSSSQLRPTKNRFRYRMQGLQTTWLPVEKGQNSLTFPDLPPGHYTLNLQASNNDGRWSDQTTTFTFTIQQPWWRSWLAYAIYSISVLALLLLTRRQFLRRQQLKNQVLIEQIEKEKALELQQVRERFFANISHEFRTPITLIKAPLEDLLANKNESDNSPEYRQMHQNTERLLHLVNQLLELTRLEVGVVQLQEEANDIFLLLRQIANDFQSLARQKRLDFQFRIPADRIILTYDKDKLEKIILNLLFNAMKFAPTGGWVTFRAAYQDQLTIEVGNNGPVIPAEEQARIFHRFHHTADARHQGTGIGLSLVKEFTDLFGGEVSVNSGQKQGTWFRVMLPLQKTENLQASTQPVVRAAIHPTTVPLATTATEEEVMPGLPDKPLLLIVDDHPEVRQLIFSKLKSDFQIIQAENGQEGFEKALRQLPHLIISDLMMPVMDGMDFCQQIKTDYRTDHIPFILLTVKSSIESRLAGLERGADDYLAKPFNSQELIIRSRNLILQRKKLQARYKQKIEIAPSEIEISSAEKKFIQKAIAQVERQLDNPAFSVDNFAQQMQLSRVHLHRKLKAITDMNATDFVRNLRLERAAALLKQQSDSVSQIAYQVGFQNLSYFAKCFKEKYAVSPSGFVKKSGK